MTLVIVEQSSSGTVIQADTRLSPILRHGIQRDDGHQFKIPGALKIFILSADYCLCFAGAHEIGLKALRKIMVDGVSESLPDIKKTIDIVHNESYESSETETDFILTKRVNGSSLVWRNKSVNETHENCYIGNYDAYNAIDPSSEDCRNIFDIVSNKKYGDVAGLVITVADNGESFYYRPMLGLYAQDPEWAHTSFGFTWTTVSPFIPIPYLGVYFYGAGFGYVYDPNQKDSADKIRSNSMDDFKIKSKMEESYCIRIGPAEENPQS